MPRFNQHCLDDACPWGDEIWAHPGQNPLCPLCGGPTERLWTAGPFVITDDIPGGMTLENMGPEPVTVYSKSERRRLMKERGLEERVRHVPAPEGSKQHTINFDVPSARMLEEATALVSRMDQRSFREEPTMVPVESMRFDSSDRLSIDPGDPTSPYDHAGSGEFRKTDRGWVKD